MKTLIVALLTGVLGCASFQPVSAAQAGKFSEKILHSFCSSPHCADGEYPSSALIDVNGTLYGTTSLGGTKNGGEGSVIAINPETGKEKVVYSFCSNLQGYYCLDGALPRGGLLEVNGTLYGTTEQGGNIGCEGKGCGTVFSIDLSTGAETVLHNFGGGADGSAPLASLLDVNGVLYGTTFAGGSGCDNVGCGVVFALDPSAGMETVLHSFGSGNDGSEPSAALIDVKGTLYGTTSIGGSYAAGTIFSIDLHSGTEAVLYSFCSDSGCSDGATPESALIDVNGVLYGTTYFGTTAHTCFIEYPFGCGTVFSFNPGTGAEAVMYGFCVDTNCSDGEFPQSGLINIRGVFYGTTYAGGQSTSCLNQGCGTVFSLDPKTGAEKVLYSFGTPGGDGLKPVAGLVALKGNLYGTTFFGGGNKNAGTVFELDKH